MACTHGRRMLILQRGNLTYLDKKVLQTAYMTYRYAPHNDVLVNDGPHIRQ
jgi:hypothetical protein